MFPYIRTISNGCQIYGDLFGFEVAETTNSGMGIITGDIRAAMPSYPIDVSLGGGNVYISGTGSYGTSPYGGGWMGIALHEIGHSIGKPHSYDLPSYQGGSPVGEDQYPTAHDINHGQRINPNNASDIDHSGYHRHVTGGQCGQQAWR